MQRKRLYFLSILISFLLIVGGIYYWTERECHIFFYNPARDREAVIEIFDQNWYWLINMERDEYDLEYHLDNLASSTDPRDRGNLTIYAYLEDGITKGFVAYYKKSFYKTKILYLAVHKDYRKHGYAIKLLSHVIKELKKKGMKIVMLVTRVTNERARNLYKKLGFEEIGIDNGFVEFEKKI